MAKKKKSVKKTPSKATSPENITPPEPTSQQLNTPKKKRKIGLTALFIIILVSLTTIKYVNQNNIPKTEISSICDDSKQLVKPQYSEGRYVEPDLKEYSNETFKIKATYPRHLIDKKDTSKESLLFLAPAKEKLDKEPVAINITASKMNSKVDNLAEFSEANIASLKNESPTSKEFKQTSLELTSVANIPACKISYTYFDEESSINMIVEQYLVFTKENGYVFTYIATSQNDFQKFKYLLENLLESIKIETH